MTEFEIGTHCSHSECNLLDFLPIRCQYCQNIFCKEHSSMIAHNCTFISNDAPNSITKHPSCELPNCSCRQPILFLCESCNRKYCSGHKQKELHHCDGLKLNSDISSHVVHNIDYEALHAISHGEMRSATSKKDSKPMSERAKSTMARLVLIQSRMQAIPADKSLTQVNAVDRFVLRLKLSDLIPSSNSPSIDSSTANYVPMAFGKNWPLGRVLDFACDHFKLSRKPNTTKLGLIRINEEDDESMPNMLDLSLKLSEHDKMGNLKEGDLLHIISYT